MNIRLTFDGKAVDARLPDNATARDLFSLLPITLTLEDYNATEKIGYPPRKLSTAGAPAGVDPSVGDIAYYAPWGNLAIFYKDFGYSSGLIGLGRIGSGVEALTYSGSSNAMSAVASTPAGPTSSPRCQSPRMSSRSGRNEDAKDLDRLVHRSR